MDFEPSDDQRMLADSLQRFLRERYPFAERQRISASPAGADAQVWRQLAEIGALGALFGEADGGYGGSGFDVALVFEALGRSLVVEPLCGALMAGQALAACGARQAPAELEALIRGERIVLLALEEGDTGAEPARVGLRAQAGPAGTWRLSGAKSVLAQARLADAFVVAARSAGGASEALGLSLFLVPAQSPGLEMRDTPLVDGGRGAELHLRELELPADALLGTAGEAQAALERAVGAGLLALCAEALGAMEAAKEATLEYLRTRRQFGVPIGSFQALQHRMADLWIEIEQARSSVINAAAAMAPGTQRKARERALSAAKYTIGRAGTHVAEECIQLHGGMGVTWELPLAHYAKRLVMIDHELGDEDEHLERYIALS